MKVTRTLNAECLLGHSLIQIKNILESFITKCGEEAILESGEFEELMYITWLEEETKEEVKRREELNFIQNTKKVEECVALLHSILLEFGEESYNEILSKVEKIKEKK